MSTLIKLIFTVIIISAIVAFITGIYRKEFQFNDQDVKDYINEEAEIYPLDRQAAVYKTIKDGVMHILSDKQLTKQVLTAAKDNGTNREQELVHAAIMQAKSYGYLVTTK